MPDADRSPVIVSAARTPIGRYLGGLSPLKAPELGAVAVREAVKRAGVELGAVEDVILGHVLQGGTGQAPARQAALKAGLPGTVAALTINKVCGSGLKAVMLAAQAIKAGEGHCIVAGGMESMSRVPYMFDARWGVKMGHQPLVDGMYRDGFLCPISEMIMGETAELPADQYKIGREEQDEYAVESQRRAVRATAECSFKAELAPIDIADRSGKTTRFEHDEHVRDDVKPESLAKLKPVFRKTGTVTAGNSSGITDAAAAVVLVSEGKLGELGLEPLARIADATMAAETAARSTTTPAATARIQDRWPPFRARRCGDAGNGDGVPALVIVNHSPARRQPSARADK